MPTRNTDLLHAIARQIEAQPETYDQSVWVSDTPCGTTACIAGWAALLSEGDITIDEDVVYMDGGRRQIDVHTYASSELGLDRHEAMWLFDGHWRPAKHLTVSEALVKFANGADIQEVTQTGEERVVVARVFIESIRSDPKVIDDYINSQCEAYNEA